MKKILIIDTTISKKSTVKLIIGEKSTKFSGNSLLPLIDKVLKKCNTKIEEISQIKINTGLGSYTGLRIGFSVANALNYLLKIKINNRNKYFFPEY